uniref:prostaglandin E2 receptor EP4 subtype-like n=1 Tax=Styela clava TaxID=7725 RepID=UPI001939FDED|nr:prostaglandin E2 receptor EP4 subtype-like [Styela clava]
MDMDLQNVTTRNTGYVPLSELDYIVIDSKKALPIPCLMFALGVLGNMLGIVSLVRYKYRRARPHSPLTCSSAYTPSPNFREKNGDRSRDVSDFNHQQRKVSTGMRNKNDILPGTKRRRKNKFGPFHTLVLALIAVDLAGNLATSPVTLYLYATNTTIKAAGGDALCNYSAFAMMFFGIVTMASLTTMAIERVLSIQCPYFYHRHVTSRTANIAILIILVSSTIFTALPSMGFGTVRPMFPYTWCFADWQAKEPKAMAFNFIYAISGIIMIFTTLICNIIVVVGLFKMKSRMATVHGRRKSTVRRETQMIIQLIVMTCIYLICWLPLMIRILDNQITRQRNGEQDRIAIWLAAANPILDPWVTYYFEDQL